MQYQGRLMKKVLIGLALAASVMTAFGQGYKGSIRVSVGADGAALPGAIVSLTASTFNRSFVTDASGDVRFVGLTPDKYELKVTMSGFNTVVRPNVVVDTGANVRLVISMEPSTQAEEMVVTQEIPLMDQTKMGTGTVLTTDELEMLPQARDPWAVLDSIPGLQTDRINIGGNESGQQGQWVGKGDNGTNSAWIIDGVEFTDFAAEGASQSYLDFGSFQQIGFETGGSGVETGASGTVLNFVTKQGSNRHTGSMRLLWADEDFSSTNVDRNDPANINPDGSLKQNTVFETFEKGFEIGGPIIKDRLWYWGAFNQNSIKNIVRSGQRDDTELENISLKIHGDITSSTRATFFYTEGDKLKFGRGAGNSRAPETTWNQTGPSPIYKFEISQTIGQHTELQFIYGRVDGGFQLEPIGDSDTIQASYNEVLGRWENTYANSINNRPQRNYVVKGSTFISSSKMDHELSYGFDYKEAQADFRQTWGEGSGNLFVDDYHGFGDGSPSYVYFYRDSATSSAIESTNVHVQDSMTFGNWTVKAGLRFNRSEGNNVGASINANPLIPDIVPALAYQGDEPQFTWNTIAPQIAATYTFGEDNQFLVRGSYRKYYDNISTGDVNFINPVGAGRVIAYWSDTNGDGQFQLGEEQFPVPSDPYFWSSGINRQDPASATSLDTIDPNLEPPEVDEFILGGEWSITPTFSVAMSYTYRNKSNFSWTPLIDETTGQPLDRSFYQIIATGFDTSGGEPIVNPATGETVELVQWARTAEGRDRTPNEISRLMNRPDYEQNYHGLELTLTKRMSNRWMMRGHISWQDWTRDVGPNSLQNPEIGTTRAAEDGSPIVVQSTGSGDKGDVFMGSATYTAHINGVYQLPWDMAISGNLTAREGYALPLYYNFTNRDPATGTNATSSLSAGPIDQYKADDIFLCNLKLSKVFKMGSTKVDLGVEVFNVFNDDAIMQTTRRIDTMATDENGVRTPRIDERLAPRLARFSATINF